MAGVGVDSHLAVDGDVDDAEIVIPQIGCGIVPASYTEIPGIFFRVAAIADAERVGYLDIAVLGLAGGQKCLCT